MIVALKRGAHNFIEPSDPHNPRGIVDQTAWRVLSYIAVMTRVPITVTSGWHPRDTRANHRRWGVIDVRTAHLSPIQLETLVQAFKASGFHVDHLGPSQGYAPHLHVHMVNRMTHQKPIAPRRAYLWVLQAGQSAQDWLRSTP